MILAFAFSAERGLCAGTDVERIRAHLATAGLPTRLDEMGIAPDGKRLAGHMLHDKKKEGGRIAFILARGIGQAFVDKRVDLAEVADFLDRQG